MHRTATRGLRAAARHLHAKTTPGVFGLPGLHCASDWAAVSRACISRCEELAKRIRETEGVSVLHDFDRLSNEICQVLDVAELCRNVHPDAEFVHGAQDAFMEVSSMVQELNADYALYEPLAILHEQTCARPGLLEGEDLVMVRSLKVDFERGGINLRPAQKRRLLELQGDINQYSSSFMAKGIGPVPHIEVPRSEIGSLPRTLLGRLDPSPTRPGHVLIPADADSSQTALKWVRDGSIREEIYRRNHAYMSQGKLEILDALLGARKEVATILGSSSYAQLMFEGRLAASPEAVSEFLESLSMLVSSTALEERHALEREKVSLEGETSLQALSTGPFSQSIRGWDRSYYIGRVKAKEFEIDAREISQYLPLSACLNGFAEIISSAFGVTMRMVEPEPGEAWHAEVQKVQLTNERGEVLGHIFLDLYPRAGKYAHAAHFCIRCGRSLGINEPYQTPIVALVCNFRRSAQGESPLLTFAEYETVLHELGHSMHSILSRTKYQHLSGTRVATDLVEVPSHVFENFAWDPRVLSRVARHHRTGEQMPTRMLRALCASRNGFMATDIQAQVLFSAMDLSYHGPDPPIGSTSAVLEKLQTQLTAFQADSGVPVQALFQHFVGYGAGYYSYLFARVISAQIWSSLFHEDPYSRQAGLRLQNEMLRHGAARAPSELVHNVLQSPPSCVPFLKSLGIDASSTGQKNLALPLTSEQ